MAEAVYIANDNLLVVDQLKNALSGTYINNATVTCTIVDSAGSPVAGQTWPLAVVYQAGSNGQYVGVIEDTLTLSETTSYIAKVDADGGSGLKGHWEIPLKAKVRRS